MVHKLSILAFIKCIGVYKIKGLLKYVAASIHLSPCRKNLSWV